MVAYFRPLLHASTWQLASWLCGLAAALRWQPDWASGVFWGGLVMALNFWSLRFVAHLWYRNRGLSGGVLALVASKLVLLLGLLAAILHYAAPDPVGLTLGLATLFLGMLGACLPRLAPTSHRRPRTVQGD